MSGCDWNKKKFTVHMSPGIIKLSRCHECANNKYYAGPEDLCDKCVNHNNFKQGGSMVVEEKVKQIIVENLGLKIEDITRESNFTEDFGGDSLDLLELTLEFENAFDIEIPDADAEKLSTVGQVIDYIKSKTIK